MKITLLVFNIERWVDFYRIVQTGIARTSVGYVFHELMTTGISLAVSGFASRVYRGSAAIDDPC